MKIEISLPLPDEVLLGGERDANTAHLRRMRKMTTNSAAGRGRSVQTC
jgi:hypothetical protein